MNADDKIAAARRQLAEVEALVLQGLASARGALVVVEEENRELRREALARRAEYYTEREFARILKVSESTVKRLRLGGKLQFTTVGSQVRYTAEHLGQFPGQQLTPRASRRRSRGGLRSVG